MFAGDGRQVLVKAKAAHYLHDIGSGKMAAALQICIAEQQARTLSDLLECLRKLMQPVVDKEVFSLLSNVQHWLPFAAWINLGSLLLHACCQAKPHAHKACYGLDCLTPRCARRS